MKNLTEFQFLLISVTIFKGRGKMIPIRPIQIDFNRDDFRAFGFNRSGSMIAEIVKNSRAFRPRLTIDPVTK